MARIMLHRKKGLNPRMTCCRNCGKDVGIALLGVKEYFYKCSCGASCFGGKPERGKKCPKCGSLNSYERDRIIEDHERLPIELCKNCQKKEKAAADEVKKGGIYWRCKDCGSAGVIKSGHPLSVKVREQLKVLVPKPCGIEFSKAYMCPVCGTGERT